MLTQLSTIYTDYEQTIRNVRQNARAFDGLFGMGKDPKKDACHDAFYQAAGQWVTDFLATEPTQEQVMEAALYLLETPIVYADQECYWYMYAAQGHIKPMIPALGKENCKALAQRLEACYPKRERMPLQQQLLKMLMKAGK